MEQKLLTLLVLATFSCANALTSCYSCSHVNILEGQASTEPAMIAAVNGTLSLFESDTNCLLQGSDYTSSTSATKVACTTHCLKAKGEASYLVGTETLRFEVTGRTCTDATNTDTKDTCSYTSPYYLGISQLFLTQAGLDSTSFAFGSDTKFCYCDVDDCNSATVTNVSFIVMVIVACLSKMLV